MVRVTVRLWVAARTAAIGADGPLVELVGTSEARLKKLYGPPLGVAVRRLTSAATSCRCAQRRLN